MSKTTPISEMQKFRFGATIVCSDGEDGTLSHVIFDPTSRRITYIGVRHGRFLGKTVQLPYTNVVDATGERVTLNVKLADLAAASSTEVVGAMLDSKSRVKNTENAGADGQGTLMLVVVHPESGELSYIVAHHVRAGQDTFIRDEHVTNLETGQVTVSLSSGVLDALPPYRPDSVLQQEVEAILFDLTPLHIDLKGIQARVLDAVLYLEGNISSSLRADIARDQVAGVAGLLEIKSDLVGDDALAANLALALSQDPRTPELPIGVYPRLGVVRLSGAVHTSQQKAAAGEIARTFPGVRSVINELAVNPKSDHLYIMSSAEGGGTQDKVPGKYVRHTK